MGRNRTVRVVFVAPFFMPMTLRFVDAVARHPGAAVGLVSQSPVSHLPPGLRRRLAAHYRVDNALDAGQLLHATRAIGGELGGLDRVLGALEQLQVPLGVVRDRLGVAGMGEGAAKNFRDKARMKDVMSAAGLPCARHDLVRSTADAVRFVKKVGLPVVIKPPAGAAAVGTFRVTNEGDLSRALASLRPSAGNPAVIEEFMTGEERSCETVTIRGEPVWDSMTRYAPTPLHVLDNPWIQWTVLLPRERENPEARAIRGPARAALKALGMHTGLSHLEWFRTPRRRGGVAISEVAARPPGAQIVPLNGYAHDVDFMDLWAELVVHERFEPPTRRYAAGVAFFRAQHTPRRHGGGGQPRIVAIDGLDHAQREVGHLVIETRLPKIGAVPGRGYEGDGYAIVRHPDTSVVEKALGRLISLVRVRAA